MEHINVSDILNKDEKKYANFIGVDIQSLGFLEPDKPMDSTVFVQILDYKINIKRCPFQGNESKCPKFELANEPMSESEKAGVNWCSAQRWDDSKAYCELLPVEEEIDDIECQCNGNCVNSDDCLCQQIPCADLEEICEHSRGCLDECGCSCDDKEDGFQEDVHHPNDCEYLKNKAKKKEKTMPIFTITVELTGHKEIEVEAKTVEEAVNTFKLNFKAAEIAASIEEIKAVSATDEGGNEVWQI